MLSPTVAVLKGSSGKGGVRLAIDYRCVNLHSQGDAFVIPHLLDSIQKVGAARYIYLSGTLWSLNKFRAWIFGLPITIFANSNPLTYLTNSTPKSAKTNSLDISSTRVSYRIRLY